MARSSQVFSTERREGVSMTDVVMEDIAIGDPVVPNGPALALVSLFPRHPYSAVPFRDNLQLWRNSFCCVAIAQRLNFWHRSA